MHTIETTITVDQDGIGHLDRPLAIAPGRHRAVVVIDEAMEAVGREPWPEFIDRTYRSLADSDLARHPQGVYEQREEMTSPW